MTNVEACAAIAEMKSRGIKLTEDGGKLRAMGKGDALTAAARRLLKSGKVALIAALRVPVAVPPVLPPEEVAHVEEVEADDPAALLEALLAARLQRQDAEVAEVVAASEREAADVRRMRRMARLAELSVDEVRRLARSREMSCADVSDWDAASEELQRRAVLQSAAGMLAAGLGRPVRVRG